MRATWPSLARDQKSRTRNMSRCGSKAADTTRPSMGRASAGTPEIHDIVYLPAHLGGSVRTGHRYCFGRATRFAQHTGFPVERVSCRTDDCTGGDSQSDRLTDLPRPGQPFPRSLAQERGFLAVRRMQAASEQPDRRSAGCVSRPGIRSPAPHESLSSCSSDRLGPLPVWAGDALIPAACHRAAGMFFAPSLSRPGYVQRIACCCPLSQPARRWFPTRRIRRRASALRD